MDEKLKIPSSSCETPLHVLDSPESNPEICEQAGYLASTSVTENTPVASLEPMPNIKMVKIQINVGSASDKSLDDSIKSISDSVKLLRAAQRKCSKYIKLINREFKMLPNYLESASSPEELVAMLKSPTAAQKLMNAEKNTNSYLSLIKTALGSVTGRINLPPSSIRELKIALKLLKKLIKKIDPKQENQKEQLTQIVESLEDEEPQSSVYTEAIDSLIQLIKLSIAELSEINMYFNSFKISLHSIKVNFPQLKEIKSSESENSVDTD